MIEIYHEGDISWKWILFPLETVSMKNGEQHKFIIFNKPRFEKWFQEYCPREDNKN